MLSGGARKSRDNVSALSIGLNKGIVGWINTNLLHMCANTQQQAEMDTERSNIRSCLAADPENAKMPIIVELI